MLFPQKRSDREEQSWFVVSFHLKRLQVSLIQTLALSPARQKTILWPEKQHTRAGGEWHPHFSNKLGHICTHTHTHTQSFNHPPFNLSFSQLQFKQTLSPLGLWSGPLSPPRGERLNYIVLLLHWVSHLKTSHHLTIVFCSFKKKMKLSVARQKKQQSIHTLVPSALSSSTVTVQIKQKKSTESWH